MLMPLAVASSDGVILMLYNTDRFIAFFAS
jgi:hypothetical protein